MTNTDLTTDVFTGREMPADVIERTYPALVTYGERVERVRLTPRRLRFFSERERVVWCGEFGTSPAMQ